MTAAPRNAATCLLGTPGCRRRRAHDRWPGSASREPWLRSARSERADRRRVSWARAGRAVFSVPSLPLSKRDVVVADRWIVLRVVIVALAVAQLFVARASVVARHRSGRA